MSPTPPPPGDRRLRLLLRLAGLIRRGTLTIVLPDGARHVIEAGPGTSAVFIVKDARAVRRLLTGGNLGLAEAYLDGLWDTPDLRAVMRLAASNETIWEAVLAGRPWMRALARLGHRLRANTRRGARRNIAEHYDLGNEFYAEWLDATMTYSSALFGGNDDTLEAAQLRKIHRLCQALELRPGMRVLEIGCGWGDLPRWRRATTARWSPASPSRRPSLPMRRRGSPGPGWPGRWICCWRTTATCAAVSTASPASRCSKRWARRTWPDFFAAVRDRLAPGGRAGLQIITIADRFFETYRRSADFIQRHIFPGGMLPSPKRLHEEVARAGLAWTGEHWFGRDYAETLARWQTRFQAAWPRIVGATRLRARPADERFKRLWDYYLAYCETGFRAGWTNVGQIVLVRPA